MDFRGRETPVTRVRGWYGNPRFSPDGSRLAITDGPASGDVAVLDLSRGAKMRVTTHHASDIAPIWSPDGTRLAFRSDRDGGVYNIHWQRADGSGRAERLAASRTVQAPADWTRDGRTLIYTDLRPGTGLDIMSLTFTDPQLVRPLVATKFTQTEPALSPDGRWLAYQSDELGHFEVELRPYPDVDRMRLQVSTDGGTRPVWSPDSRAVFFVHGGAIYRAAVSDGQPFRVGRPERVLQNLPTEALGFFYTVAPDGNRFVIVRPVSGSGLAAEYRVLSDWRAVADNR
jgi:serine/threonine-protein kinase